tara:strand:+ start:3942 stop:4142 length:201 start_codon:yes stop_codon:yes gene_type:complete
VSDRSKDLKEIINQIQSWHSEAVNFRNDGWVQQEYKNRLETLHARVTAVMESIRAGNENTEKSEED